MNIERICLVRAGFVDKLMWMVFISVNVLTLIRLLSVMALHLLILMAVTAIVLDVCDL